MLPVNEVVAIVEENIAAGEDRVDALVDAVYERFSDSVEAESAIRSLCSRRVSLAIAKVCNEDGERLAFPDRDPEDGERRVVHLHYSQDPRALLRISARYKRISDEAKKVSERTYERAVQLGLFDQDHKPLPEPAGASA